MAGATTIPSGTVTFLFTDVQESTRLWQDHPREMSAALARHDEILRAAIESRDGYVFSTAGDAFAAAFASAGAALDAAVSAQSGLDAEPWGDVEIRVRMGLHTGAAEERGGDYFGPVLNRTARIMALGGGRQVLLSSAARDRVGDSTPDGFELRDIGEHRLKSLHQPEHLFQLTGPGLSDALISSAAAAIGNLPTGVADFVGHAGDVEQLRRSVAPGRVLTITGIGGAGKTQLATRVAAAFADAYPEGVWWCDLTPLTVPELIPGAVGSTLGFVIDPDLDPPDAVAEALLRRRVLLVLDNCEHLLDGVAALLEVVMRRCPGVAVIATSRAPVGVRDEVVWPIRPLDTATEALELLVTRAVAADSGLDPRAWDHDELVELCEHLDGIPLAIEMAAARLRTLTPRQILDRLEDRFRVLRSRRRDGADRHQTLLAMLDWSYRLLPVEEQLLLDGLAVFAGTFDLAAAEAVCGGDDLDAFDLDDLLAALVDKSLVTPVRTEGRIRYRLLETIRDYGLVHLDERDATLPLRRRHAEVFSGLAESAALRYSDRRFWSGLASFVESWNDILAAISWAIGRPEPALVRRFLLACTAYAIGAGRSELGELARTLLDAPDPPAIAYGLASFFADGREQVALAEAGLGITGADGVEKMVLSSQLAAGLATTGVGGTVDAIMQATRYAHEFGSPTEAAYWEAIIAEALATRQPEVAAHHAADARALLDGWLDHPSASGALGRIADYEARSGRLDAALDICRQTTLLVEDAGLPTFRAYVVGLAARIAAARTADNAAELLQRAIEEARSARWWFNVWPVASGAGRWFEATGRRRAAAVVDGHFAQRGRTRAGYDLVPDANVDLSGHDDGRRLGAAMSADEFVDFVVAELAAAGTGSSPD